MGIAAAEFESVAEVEIGVPDRLRQLNDDISGAIDRAYQALVQITNGERSIGAGTIWHPAGLILTNAHVVRDETPNVTLNDGRSFPAQVLYYNAELDLAALNIEATDLPTIEPGDSKELKPGEWVMALGHPWGIRNAVSGGIVIGMGAEMPDIPFSSREWVVVSLHMRPGHSGGPLIDTAGRLVGINTMISGPDVGVAIPVHVVKKFLKDSMA
ncbi:MAG: trypsin-like peptidase domain-containing protein [Chloroflexi bacterium]|nr:trypsin-like peptidase domain-containing protein [Chloroflexota bacterium]